MTVKEMKELITNLSDDVEIEINSIYKDGEWELSSICEAHYDKNRNKVCVTPTFLHIEREDD